MFVTYFVLLNPKSSNIKHKVSDNLFFSLQCIAAQCERTVLSVNAYHLLLCNYNAAIRRPASVAPR